MSLEEKLEASLGIFEEKLYEENLDDFSKKIIIPLTATMLQIYKRSKNVDSAVKEIKELKERNQEIREDFSQLVDKLNNLDDSFNKFLTYYEASLEKDSELKSLEMQTLTKLINALG